MIEYSHTYSLDSKMFDKHRSIGKETKEDWEQLGLNSGSSCDWNTSAQTTDPQIPDKSYSPHSEFSHTHKSVLLIESLSFLACFKHLTIYMYI